MYDFNNTYRAKVVFVLDALADGVLLEEDTANEAEEIDEPITPFVNVRPKDRN